MIERKRRYSRSLAPHNPAAGAGLRLLRKSRRSAPRSRADAPSPNRTSGLGWTSGNWSGYALSGTRGYFRHVSGEWRVPFVRPTADSTYSSAWIGIDGFRNSSLIQTGTAHEFDKGAARYYAWWEILPEAETRIPGPVFPGDRMRATIRRLSTGKWRISICNLTRRWAFRTIRAYSGPLTSAEWILEAPLVGGRQSRLASISPTIFYRCRANGHCPRLTARDGGVMSQDGLVVSVPSLPTPPGDTFVVRRRFPARQTVRASARPLRRRPGHTKSNG